MSDQHEAQPMSAEDEPVLIRFFRDDIARHDAECACRTAYSDEREIVALWEKFASLRRENEALRERQRKAQKKLSEWTCSASSADHYQLLCDCLFIEALTVAIEGTKP